MRRAHLFLLWIALGLLTAAAGMKGQTVAPAEPQLAILDTDIGDDIDDAFALALALRSPELKILGVTTAFGETELRARLVERYLAAVGRGDIAVRAGVATPHSNVFTQATYARQWRNDSCMAQLTAVSPTPLPQGDKDRYAGCEKERGDAVGFLLRSAREHPGKITLIALGPLTNVQAAIERDAAGFRQLKRVVLMGGSILRGYDDMKTGAHRPAEAEWNIARDPAGLRALLASSVPVYLLPLDSTQIHLEDAAREAIFAHGSPLTDQLTLLYHQWRAGTEWHPAAPTLFDPVAVAYAVRPELCPAAPMHIEVDEQGYTRATAGAANAQVCLQSDEKGFLALLQARIAGDVPAK